MTKSQTMARRQLSRRETSVLCGVPLSAVDKAIEQETIRASRRGREVAIPATEIAALLLIRRISMDGFSLPRRLRKEVRNWVVQAFLAGTLGDFAISDSVTVSCPDDVMQVARNAADYAANRDTYLVTDPSVKGGDATIVGTRLTARAVLARIDGGDSMDDLIEDYPYVAPEALEAALVYARSNPQRGRPRRPAPTAA